MNNFQYLDLNTLMHRLTPAVKLVWFVVSAVIVAVCQDLTVALFMAVFFVVLWYTTRLHKQVFGLLKSLFPYLFMIFLVWVLIMAFSEDGRFPPIFQWGIICIDWADLGRGLMTFIRVFLMISSFYLLIMTTNFSEIISGLNKLFIPYKVAFSVGLVFQAIPIMINEYETIVDAQRSRGLEIDKGGILTRIKNYAVVLLPLFVRVLNKSQNMTTSMFVYKLDLSGKRMPFKDMKAGSKDFIFILLWVVLWAAAIYIYTLKPIIL